MSTLNPRHQVICDLCPNAEIIVDVGADHGYVAAHLHAIASERMPHRRGKTKGPWVIADGLKPFQKVDVAIITGMGAHKIADIIRNGPTVPTIIAHATDSPGNLRQFLASHGWAIAQEVLVPEGNAYAEVIRAERGEEKATDFDLEFGPVLTSTNGPLHQAHFAGLLEKWTYIARASADYAPDRARGAHRRIEYLEQVLKRISV